MTEDIAARSVPHAGTYRRRLPVTLDRLYENALDWEHLPYLHRTSFTAIDVIDAGTWGWRATVGLAPHGRPIVLELALDRDCRRWITRTLEGPGIGTEIWTHAFATAERDTEVVVDFFLPSADPSRLASLGDAYCSLYERLYDEDESMMVGRQTALDRCTPDGEVGDSVELGARDQLVLPMTVAVAGAPVCVVEVDGDLVAFGATCPHRLGPLHEGRLVDGVIECPWHGYQFDVRSGREITGKRCRLPAGPSVAVDDRGTVTVSAPVRHLPAR